MPLQEWSGVTWIFLTYSNVLKGFQIKFPTEQVYCCLTLHTSPLSNAQKK